MNNLDVQLVEAALKFSEQFGVEPPKNKVWDVRSWWLNALKQMDKENVYMLYELFSDDSGVIGKIMRADLIARKLELDAEHQDDSSND